MNILEVSEREINKELLDNFYENHKDCVRRKMHKPFFSTTGGHYSFLVTPTGLGSIVSIKCNACGEMEDITNNENW